MPCSGHGGAPVRSCGGENGIILRRTAVLVSVVHPPDASERFFGAHLVFDCSSVLGQGGQGVGESRLVREPQCLQNKHCSCPVRKSETASHQGMLETQSPRQPLDGLRERLFRDMARRKLPGKTQPQTVAVLLSACQLTFAE